MCRVLTPTGPACAPGLRGPTTGLRRTPKGLSPTALPLGYRRLQVLFRSEGQVVKDKRLMLSCGGASRAPPRRLPCDRRQMTSSRPSTEGSGGNS